jgi:hypothetical protein
MLPAAERSDAFAIDAATAAMDRASRAPVTPRARLPDCEALVEAAKLPRVVF